MRGRTSATQLRATVPAIGRWVPAAVLHLAFVALAASLSFLVLASPFWRGIGVLLAIAATLLPGLVHTWWLLLLLGLSQVWREPSATDAAFYLLLAGVHLLHVLDSLARLLPWAGRMQLGALRRPLQRFALIQLVVQVVAVATLLAFGDRPGKLPGLSIVSAMALAVVAAALIRRLRQSSPPGQAA